MKKHRLVFAPLVFIGMTFIHAKDAAPVPSDSDVERYREHVLVVDPDGTALLPTVTHEGEDYKVSLKEMEGEDTRKIENAATPRPGLYKYLDHMFKAIARNRPENIVIYIHGGLNDIGEATAKSADMADQLRDADGGYSKYYPICICWSSNVDTYFSHVVQIRGGLHVSPMEGWATAPLYFLADIATACVRAPVTWRKDLDNDLYAVNPRIQHRYRHTIDRYKVLYDQSKADPEHSASVSRAEDGREDRPDALTGDVGLWLLTLPEKLTTSLILDSLGPEAWHVMLRRTRTMFERESSFVPSLDDTIRYAKDHHIPWQKFRSQVLETSRSGALSIFLSDAKAYLNVSKNEKFYKSVTLAGHSMGAIVANEMLQNTNVLELPEITATGKIDAPIVFNNIVYMAAACTIRDFKRDAVPYMELHPNVKFYNLSLHDNAERSEKFTLDLTPRGSLLVWIDSFLDNPPSEDDRTLGRWENAVLMTDDIPSNVLSHISLKSFGRNRLADNGAHELDPPLDYTVGRVQYKSGLKYIAEPTDHGSFSRFNVKNDPKKPNFAFWMDNYWKKENAKDSTPPKDLPPLDPLPRTVRKRVTNH